MLTVGELMTISAEKVFGPTARSTWRWAYDVLRVDRRATCECAGAVICWYSCPMPVQLAAGRAGA